MLAPSVVKKVPDLSQLCKIADASEREKLETIGKQLQWSAFLRPYTKIPFHKDRPSEENTYDGFAVVPSDGNCLPAALIVSIERSRKDLEWLKSLAPNPAAQSKYEQALKWLKDVSTAFRDLDNSAKGQGMTFER
jgi:hypothetical protein